MSKVKPSRRRFLQLSAAAVAVASRDFAVGGQAAAAPGADTVFPIFAPEGGRVVVDAARIPQTLQEAPALAALVRQGRLPPVRERIGLDPLVIEPLHKIGRYGGTLHRGFTGPGDQPVATRFASGPDSFLYWDYRWQTIVPNIAKGYELSKDARTLTLFLRRGMRWSDGAPFTSDDVMFWYTDLYRDRRVVGGSSAALMLDGKEVVIEQIDRETVQFIAPAPYPLLPELLAGYTDLAGPASSGRFGTGGYAPRHYLAQFHPKYRSEAEVTRAAREAGFASWAIWLRKRNDWLLNTQLPVLSPWRVSSPINSAAFILERNPYSIWIDTAGNQLPYIDRISHALCSTPEAVVFKAVAGELDFQDRHLDVAKLPVLLSNRRRSGYRVYLDPFAGTDLGVRINLAYSQDAEIGALLRTPEFRRALSLGVDREAINETFMLGMGQPSAAVPTRDSKYFPGEEWVSRWARHDVRLADQLLDAAGLTRRDDAGFRLRRDRPERLRLVYQAYVAHIDLAAVGEMLKEQWRVIGIDLDVQVVENTLWHQRALAGSLQLTAQPTGADDPFVYPDWLFPYQARTAAASMGPSFARWFQTNGAAGEEPPAQVRRMMSLWRQGRTAQAGERLRIGQELIRIHADEVLSIGLITGGLSFYGVHLANVRLGNVPRRVVNSMIVRSPVNALPMTFFFER
jgi:peptide/nickel transport system substrate-binding protein